LPPIAANATTKAHDNQGDQAAAAEQLHDPPHGPYGFRASGSVHFRSPCSSDKASPSTSAAGTTGRDSSDTHSMRRTMQAPDGQRIEPVTLDLSGGCRGGRNEGRGSRDRVDRDRRGPGGGVCSVVDEQRQAAR